MNNRNTIQRELVKEAVYNLKSHATAEEVYDYISKKHPSVSKGTVYRNLNILAELNEIQKVEVPSEADHYDHLCHRHYHVYCEKCKKVNDVDINAVPDLSNKIKSSNGYEITDYEIIFKGICPECKNRI